ncbi:MAG: tetratricopeptide repeat protein [Methanomassiliicoccales archaeon]|nr:MAG: tetratricopeptide repeat protein [Methanomassiliicoccales archaeon]
MAPSGEILEELKEICKEARKHHGRGEFEESKKLYSEAMKIAKEHGQESDALIFNVSILNVDNRFDETISILNSVINSPTLKLRGLAFDRMGIAYDGKKEYDKAIECYKKAIDEESYDTPGYAWYNMGIAYGGKKECDKAIECYEKAIAEESYDTPGDAWNNMGVTYDKMNEHNKAIECYEKALAIFSYEKKGYAWYNLGLAYDGKKKYDKSIECYEKALKNLPFKDDPNEIARLNSMISIMKQKIRGTEATLSSSDKVFSESIPISTEKLDLKESPESRILDKIQKTGQDIATRYSKMPISSYDNVFVVLKGWSSSTPLFGSQECRGGGYFIKWQGKGIVVDPGLDFGRNFDEAGFNFQEIDMVIVSHNHTDHNQDLRLIDDIMYELAKRIDGIKYYLLTDADTRESVKFDPSEAPHRITLPRFDIERVSIGAETQLDLREIADIPLVIRYFKAEHRGAKNAVGFRLDLYDDTKEEIVRSIGMSCDTMFFNDICDDDKLGTCDLLIAHISQPESEELKDPTYLKKGHLGYRGTAKLIQNTRAKLNLVTEFWGGKGDLRIELTQGLRKLCGDMTIFPGSIGCMIDLNNLNIQCSNCFNYLSPTDILVSSPVSVLGRLQYLCPNCRV